MWKRSPYHIPPVIFQLLHPLKLLSRIVELCISLLRTDHRPRRNITVVCVSDTHCQIPPIVPYGDILIHAGDLTNNGTPEEIQAQYDWLLSLPHRHKIVIAGNHDPYFKTVSNSLDTTYGPNHSSSKSEKNQIIYLEAGSPYGRDGTVTLDFPDRHNGRIKIYGAPHTPDILGPEHVFQYPRGMDVWSNQIPLDTDIVITHGPPKYHLDLPGVQAMGDEFLLAEIRKVKPMLHVFGHIHAGKSDLFGTIKGGREVVFWDASEKHYEGAMMARPWWQDLIPIARLYHLVSFGVYGCLGVLKDHVIGSETPSTIMVNAALMYCDSGKLGNHPQVVHL